MRFIAKSPSAARPSREGAGCAGVPLSLRGFGARIWQRLRLVTLSSGFLGVFGPLSWPPRDRVAAPLSGPRLRPGARLRPGHDPPITGFPGLAGLRTPAAGYIAGIPVAP